MECVPASGIRHVDERPKPSLMPQCQVMRKQRSRMDSCRNCYGTGLAKQTKRNEREQTKYDAKEMRKYRKGMDVSRSDNRDHKRHRTRSVLNER